MTFDVTKVRSHFSALASGIAFFDGPGGSQVPDVVGARISEVITSAISNRGVITSSEQNAQEIVLQFRQAVADLVGAQPGGVVYGRSWTQLTYDFSRSLAKTWSPGDEIIVSRLDHDSNVRPWVQATERVGAVVKWAEFDLATGELAPAVIEALLTPRTKLVALTGASNVLGTRPDLKVISKSVHAVGALFYVDGVHLTPHAPIDVVEIGADFFGFSAYKIFGPHCAALVADPALLASIKNDKLLPSTDDVPERFEFGTLPYEIMAGVTAAIDFIAGMGGSNSTVRRERILTSMAECEEHETELITYMESGILSLPKVRLYSRAQNRTPTLFFDFEGINSADVYRYLATKKINAPASNFYAIESCLALGLGYGGAVRAGLAPYSTQEDVDRLLNALAEMPR